MPEDLLDQIIFITYPMSSVTVKYGKVTERNCFVLLMCVCVSLIHYVSVQSK